MYISEELRGLADLLREGHLTEEEFAEAKRQVLLQGNSEPKTQPDAVTTESMPSEERHITQTVGHQETPYFQIL
jgi:hypothetical protein